MRIIPSLAAVSARTSDSLRCTAAGSRSSSPMAWRRIPFRIISGRSPSRNSASSDMRPITSGAGRPQFSALKA